MAGKKRGRWISERAWSDLQLLLKEFRALGRTLRHTREGDGRRDFGDHLELALSNGTILPGGEATVLVADENWSAIPGRTVTATNDSAKTIPGSTRLILLRKRRKWRIVQAFICTD